MKKKLSKAQWKLLRKVIRFDKEHGGYYTFDGFEKRTIRCLEREEMVTVVDDEIKDWIWKINPTHKARGIFASMDWE